MESAPQTRSWYLLGMLAYCLMTRADMFAWHDSTFSCHQCLVAFSVQFRSYALPFCLSTILGWYSLIVRGRGENDACALLALDIHSRSRRRLCFVEFFVAS